MFSSLALQKLQAQGPESRQQVGRGGRSSREGLLSLLWHVRSRDANRSGRAEEETLIQIMESNKGSYRRSKQHLNLTGGDWGGREVLLT